MRGFKGQPKHNKVEIGYGVILEKEGQEIAKLICSEILNVALKENKELIVTAKTLM